MAYPFGGHPTFSTYLTWAAQRAGCSVKTRYITTSSGRTHAVTRVTSAHGHIIIAGVKQDDRLAPATVANYDRRLGIKSPWSFVGSDDDQ